MDTIFSQLKRLHDNELYEQVQPVVSRLMIVIYLKLWKCRYPEVFIFDWNLMRIFCGNSDLCKEREKTTTLILCTNANSKVYKYVFAGIKIDTFE